MLINSYSRSRIKKIKDFIKHNFPAAYDYTARKNVNTIKKDLIVDQDDFFNKKPLFTHVEIETINRCNNTCSFCPVNKEQDIRVKEYMDEDLFYKIIDDLESLNYSGDLSFYSNNEPLLDKRIYGFIKYAKARLPEAKHIMYTNGKILTVDRYKKLFKSGLDYLRIDNYDNDYKLIPPVKNIYDYLLSSNAPSKDKTEIVLRLKDEILSNRGGRAKNVDNIPSPLNISCYLPFYQFIIRPSGKVSMCCVDAYGTTTMGNLNDQSAEEVWFGDIHMDLLNELSKNKRKNIELCKMCDTIASKDRQIGGVQFKHVR